MENFLFNIGLLNIMDGWLPIILLSMVSLLLILSSSYATNSINKRSFKITIRSPKTLKFYTDLFRHYPFWAFFQQLIVFTTYYFVKLLFPEFLWAEEVIALLFAAFHFPNLYLMFPTSFMLIIFMFHMNLYHNIYALSTAHMVLALAYERFSPKMVASKALIWHRYIRWQRLLEKRYKLKR